MSIDIIQIRNDKNFIVHEVVVRNASESKTDKVLDGLERKLREGYWLSTVYSVTPQRARNAVRMSVLAALSLEHSNG